jgi:MFS family permease
LKIAPRERPVASSSLATVAPSYPWWANARRAPSRIWRLRASTCSSDTFGIDALYKNVRTFYIIAVLRDRSLVALLVGEIVSTTGTAMTFLALPWFVLETTGSPTRMSVVLAAELLAVAIFGVPSGSLVGRLGARRTMLASDALRAPLIALVPVLHWTGALTFGLLVGIVFVLGLVSAPYFAAQRTIVPELVGEDEGVVAKASALFGGATHITLVLGPVLGGVLVASLGAPAVLLLDGATFVFAFLAVLLFVRGGARVADGDEEARGVFAGIRFLARDPLLGPLVLTVIVLDMAAATIAVAVPLAAFVRYGESAHVAGGLFAGFGVGAVVGSAVAMKLLDRFRPLRLASAGIVLAVIPLWALVLDLPWGAAAAAFFASGVCLPLVNAPAMGLITTRPPAALRAKVMTAVMTASALGGPVGRLAVGPVYEWHGLAAMFGATALTMSIGAALFVFVALRAREAPTVSAAAGAHAT